MLREFEIMRYAEKEIAAILGKGAVNVRFFIAGGAYKSLLTGKPPRDIDIWAPSAADREELVFSLKQRNAVALEQKAFSDVYKINERVVEIAHKTRYPSLEERVNKFDVALSAIGVEHIPGGDLRGFIHSLAKKSVRQRKILLLKPLVNWKYALATLSRMRRYANELGFSSPPEEEAEIWQIFKSQSYEMRLEMIARHKNVVIEDYGVAEEADEIACRFR